MNGRGHGPGGPPAEHGRSAPGRADHFPLAAHFESPDQQYQAGKLAMWIFLVTEVLLFSGLFCAYAVYRANHPEIFLYGQRYLDTGLGGLNTLVLIMSSFTMAWAVRAAQLGQRRLLMGLLATTLLFGFTFLGVKGIEYQSKWKHGLLWGERFDYAALLHGEEAGEPGGVEPTPPTRRDVGGDPGAGETAEIAHLGRTSEGAAADPHRQAGPGAPIGDQAGATGGGRAGASGAAGGGQGALLGPPTRPAPGVAAVDPADTLGRAGALAPPPVSEGGLEPGPVEPVHPAEPGGKAGAWPRAATGPRGLAPEAAAGAPPAAHADDAVPRNVHQFFGIYFVLTGLHALHVIAGLGVIGWLLVGAARGRYGPAYFTPVDFGGLYWHLVDIIWIFLFPLLYLIH